MRWDHVQILLKKTITLCLIPPKIQYYQNFRQTKIVLIYCWNPILQLKGPNKYLLQSGRSVKQKSIVMYCPFARGERETKCWYDKEVKGWPDWLKGHPLFLFQHHGAPFRLVGLDELSMRIFQQGLPPTFVGKFNFCASDNCLSKSMETEKRPNQASCAEFYVINNQPGGGLAKMHQSCHFAKCQVFAKADNIFLGWSNKINKKNCKALERSSKNRDRKSSFQQSFRLKN